VVEIEHGALGAFQQDTLVFAQRVPDEQRRVVDVGPERLRRLDVAFALLFEGADVLVVGLGHDLGLGFHRAMTFWRKPTGSMMSWMRTPWRAALVGVAGPDSPAGGADLADAQPRFLHVVEHDVPRHDEVRLARDLETPGVDVAALQVVDLGPKDRGIDHHAVADDGDDVGVEDT